MVVPNVDEACERFEKLGVTFVKKPNDGNGWKLNVNYVKAFNVLNCFTLKVVNLKKLLFWKCICVILNVDLIIFLK